MKGVKRFAKTVDVALGTAATPCKRRTSPAGTARAGVWANHAGTAKNSLPRAEKRPYSRCDGHSRRFARAETKSQPSRRFFRLFESQVARRATLTKVAPTGPASCSRRGAAHLPG